MKIYVAGPMRGIPLYNFPAFDAAEAHLTSLGHEVLSPASMDRARGFDPAKDIATPEFLADAMRHDLEAILRVEAVVLLPGWERSTGAKAEAAVACWRGIPVMIYPKLAPAFPPGNEDILDEAKRLTGGDRMDSYGHPAQDFARIAAIWTAIKPGATFTAKDVAMMMIAVKLSRLAHADKRDSWVDIAGYARCGVMCQQP